MIERTRTTPNDDGGERRPTALVLVRCWLEPGDEGGPAVRGYLRDLKSGNEVAIVDLKAVQEHVSRLLHASARPQRQEQEVSA